MTTKRIVYRRSDGVVSVVNPAPQRLAQLMAEGNTEDEAIAIIQAKAALEVQAQGYGPPEDIEVLDVTTIPQTQPGDREFRNALEKPGMGAPVVNMFKAQNIHMDTIRSVRNSEFGRLELDRKQQTALATGDTATATAIENQKQRLRDIPQTFDLSRATTPDQLKGLWPAELPRV